MQDYFTGREDSISKLMDISRLGRSAIVVFSGRRRIGKSTLAEHFGKQFHFLPFSGTPPVDGTTAQSERNHFAQQLAANFNLPLLTFLDWTDAFNYLGAQLPQKPTVLLLDEISWMGSKDPTFIPKFKVWWDLNHKKFSKLIVILCGSVSTWIEDNILNSTALFGRISLHLHLRDLSLMDSYGLLKNKGFKGSTYDAIRFLSITGGVPWYIEQFIPQKPIDHSIKQLCFEREGLLVQEFDRIFNDLFSSKADVYRKILYALSEGMKSLADLREYLKYPNSGTLTSHLRILEKCGFVEQFPQWSLKTHKLGRKKYYRLSDNYIRFYLKYIAPVLPKIQQGGFDGLPLSSMPGIDGIIGYQVENLVIKNRKWLLKALNVEPQDVVADGPFIQSGTKKAKGCQIDYLVQTQTNNLYVCEFKFRNQEIKSDILSEMKEKIKRFSIPRGFGICPVLVHVNGVHPSIEESRYFYRIVDVTDAIRPLHNLGFCDDGARIEHRRT